MSLSLLPRLSMAVCVTAALAGPVQAQPFSQEEPDYLVPSPADPRARAGAIRSLASPAFGQGERVSYRAFNDMIYELTRFQGRHVELLLPDSWIGPNALSEEQIRLFLDRTDWTYQHFLDLVGAPPAGEGLMPVAIVPETCGLGCGWLGLKGVEMQDMPELRPLIWQEIAADMPSGVFVHEMAHNFDLFHEHIGYTPDYPHAWTDFVSYYYFHYAQEGLAEVSPDEVMNDWMVTVGRYFEDPTTDWESCVWDGLCEDRFILPELAWAGFGLKLALLDGPQTVRGFMAFLRQQQSNPPPTTIEGKNDLYVEALAAGARRNLGCIVDAWRWHASGSLRQRMSQRYRAPNPDCQDRDRDGFSPLRGDCDDRRATIHPGAAERARRVDDDCDGRIDEITLREPAGGDFAVPLQLSLPGEVVGTAGSFLDTDEFFLRLESPRRVSLELCARQHVQLILKNDAGEQIFALPLREGECEQGVLPLAAETWRFEVHLGDDETGGYSFAAQNATPWPPSRSWARTAPPGRNGNRFVLTAAALSPLPGPPTEIRFWVSGHGIVGTVPYSRAASFAWAPPAGVDPATLSYRAQAIVRGVPAARITAPQPFVSP